MKHAIRKSILMAAAFGLLTGPAIASGEGHDHGPTPGKSPGMTDMMAEMDHRMADTSAFGHEGEPAKVTRTVEIAASDIKFDTAGLTFEAGETVRFVVVNNGEQPHEFTIGDADYQETAREMMRHMTGMGMDPAAPAHAAMHASAGNTVSLDIGETKEIVWTFTKAGTFEFSCNIPGHSEVGMKGRIAVN